ncbi:MAG TPA: T9SS type A sorting domain-containing protein [Bacteroidia bacterium]|nr:T9SS type A sorting domain-containing protein [Bacteroidia bacterium]
MKKILLFLLIFIFSGARAQWINSLTVSPANPTTDDLIYVFADCDFTAGSCDQHTQGFSIAGNNIGAWALHCVGMLTVICPYTDTFALGTLPAGIYTFTFQLDQGSLPSPCTPGIVPGPSASFSFTVTFPTSVQQHSVDGMFSFFPNPAEEKITIINKTHEQMPLKIFDVAGKIIMEKILSAGSDELYVRDLKPGIYFLECGNSRFKFIRQ